MSKNYEFNDLDKFTRNKNRANKRFERNPSGYPCPCCGELSLSFQELRLKKQCKYCNDSDKIPDEVA